MNAEVEPCQPLLLRRNFSVSEGELSSWSCFLLKPASQPY